MNLPVLPILPIRPASANLAAAAILAACCALSRPALADYSLTFTDSSGTQSTATLANASIPGTGWKWEYTSDAASTSVLTLKSPGAYTLSGNGTISGKERAVTVEVKADCALTVSNLDVSAVRTTSGRRPGLLVGKNVSLNLVVGEGDTAFTGHAGSTNNTGYPGILVEEGATLTISAAEGSSGTLTATGGKWSAGIGGGTNAITGSVTINAGHITAVAGTNAAAIGCGYVSGTVKSASLGNITLNGGTIATSAGSSLKIGVSSAAASRASYAIEGIVLSPTPGSKTPPLAFASVPQFNPACTVRVDVPATLAPGTYPLVTGLDSLPETVKLTCPNPTRTATASFTAPLLSILVERTPGKGMIMLLE